jgi:hypothetical protein
MLYQSASEHQTVGPLTWQLALPERYQTTESKLGLHGLADQIQEIVGCVIVLVERRDIGWDAISAVGEGVQSAQSPNDSCRFGDLTSLDTCHCPVHDL